jgi:hypothetical protein
MPMWSGESRLPSTASSGTVIVAARPGVRDRDAPVWFADGMLGHAAPGHLADSLQDIGIDVAEGTIRAGGEQREGLDRGVDVAGLHGRHPTAKHRAGPGIGELRFTGPGAGNDQRAHRPIPANCPPGWPRSSTYWARCTGEHCARWSRTHRFTFCPSECEPC